MDKSLVAGLRKSYSHNELLENNVSSDPFDLFKLWFKEATESDIKEPNAMVLSTISDGLPCARVVLLKGFDGEGFTFFSNYNSHKGQQMFENNNVSLTFFWDSIERQVRIQGKVVRISSAESELYFWSRPRGSQIGAWVSEQSKVLKDRKELDDRLTFYENKFKDVEVIPKPEHWGGYLVVPNSIEFWQGRDSRLHDRLFFERLENTWTTSRLSP